MNTPHRGVTPIVDKVSIVYNAYPEAIASASVSPADDAMVTVSSPTFSWTPSVDYDEDMVTYTFSLSTYLSFPCTQTKANYN